MRKSRFPDSFRPLQGVREKKTKELGPSVKKLFRRWIRRDYVVENLSVKTAPEILVPPYPNNTLISTVEKFTFLFESEREFLAELIAKELKKGLSIGVFTATETSIVLNVSLCKRKLGS